MRAAAWLLVGNGAYDLACCASILLGTPTPLANLHMRLFAVESDRTNAALRRVVAYWVATYGVVRMCAGLLCLQAATPKHAAKHALGIAALTYACEAMAFAHAMAVGNMSRSRTGFVVASSAGCVLLLGVSATDAGVLCPI